jgi:hypothetical protein
MSYAEAPISAAAVNRRVEVLIRSQFSVPSGYAIVFGEKTQP